MRRGIETDAILPSIFIHHSATQMCVKSW